MKSLFVRIQLGVLLLCFLPGKGFAAWEEETVYGVSQKWMGVETELLNYVTARPPMGAGEPAAEDLLAALEDFSESVEEFLQSPLHESGRLTAFSQRDTTRHIRALLEELVRAIRAEQSGAILKFSGEIRWELARWQYLDSAMADTIHLKYFYQFIVFITLIIVMSLIVWRLIVSLEKARAKGKQSAAFSRQMALGQEQERSRIARELHDSVAQELSALEMKVSQISRLVRNRMPLTGRDLQGAEIQELCTELSVGHAELIAQVRTICNDLVPPEFRHQGLADALRRLCYDFGKTTGLECRITVAEGFTTGPMTVQMQLQCFRLVQEALGNIRKHAEAREVTVLLCNTGEHQKKFPPEHPGKLPPNTKPALLICVSDDGKGFAPPQSADDTIRLPSPVQAGSSGHFGIRGMYERIAILGGELSFISEEGEGTMVKIEAPLQ